MSKYIDNRVWARLDANVLKALKEKTEKENTTISEYVRDIISKAVMKDLDVATTAHIVGFNRSNNDKVTTINGPVAFKKTKFKLGVKNV